MINTWTRTFDDCPSGCDDELLLVALPEDPDCVVIPDLSEISDIYIEPTGADSAFDYSGGDPVENAGGIDNTDTTNAKSKWLVGIGEIGDPEEITYPAAKGRTVILKRIYTLTFRVIVKEDGVRNFLLQMQCGDTNHLFRYGTRGGKLFGGEQGIAPTSVNARLPLASGNEAVEEGTLVFTFETTNGDPPRHDNPLA